MFSGFSSIYTLFPFGVGEVGVLHGASALPAGTDSSKAVGSITGTTRALANISFPGGTEGVIKNRAQRTSEQTMSRAFPSCLLLFPPNITIFVLCFFSDFSTPFQNVLQSCSRKEFLCYVSYAFTTGPDGFDDKLVGKWTSWKDGLQRPLGCAHWVVVNTPLPARTLSSLVHHTILCSLIEITL